MQPALTDSVPEFVSRTHLIVPILLFAAVGFIHGAGWLMDAIPDLAVSVLRSLAKVRDEYRTLFVSPVAHATASARDFHSVPQRYDAD